MNRKLLKDNAKIALKRNFWLVMLVCLVANLLGVGDTGISSGSAGSSSGSSYEDDNNSDWENDDEYDFDDWGYEESGFRTMSNVDNAGQMMQMSSYDAMATAIAGMSIGLVLFIMLFVIAIALAVSAFLTYPVQVGYRRFFMLNRLDKGRFADLFSSFSPKYLNIVKGMFTTNMIIFGWTLLFIIPGIIKSYQYFFVPFILSENPDMSGARAREISTEMTDGHKWHIFVLGLSFIGWNLLAALLSVPALIATCCFMGIGGRLVYLPLAGYMAATYAELYEERREYMLCTRLASPQELCGYEEKNTDGATGFAEQPVTMEQTMGANDSVQDEVKSVEEVKVEAKEEVAEVKNTSDDAATNMEETTSESNDEV